MPDARTEHGTPIPGTNINLTDAVAYLSGVNYGSVVKVFAAVNALLQSKGVPVPDLLRFDHVPTSPVSPYKEDAASRARVRNTDAAVRVAVSSGLAARYEVLHKPIAARFDRQAGAFKAGLTD